MSKIIPGKAGSFYSFLPEGCKLCHKGAKMVLFITGDCPRDCFYCPVSEERHSDRTYANEEEVFCDMDVLEQARQMDALGTGITGGEPLLKLEKVLHYIGLLKNEFGKGHHIHMYTSKPCDQQTIKKLAHEGLDEIRFHPPVELWGELKDTPYHMSIKLAEKYGIETGIEIPSIEGAEKVAVFADKTGCFLNLNELEFSERNAMEMKNMGFELFNDISNAVDGSKLYATKAMDLSSKMHFCSSNFKDAVQLRKRLIRIANNTSRPFDEISEDGTIFHGHIECKGQEDVGSVNKMLLKLNIPADMMQMISNGIDIAWWILEDIAPYIKDPARKLYIIERYPLKNGLIVEKIPL